MTASSAQTPQHDNHHIIPRSVVKDKFGETDHAENQFNQSDNLIELPRTPNAVPGVSLPGHRKSISYRNHPTYNTYVKNKINGLSPSNIQNVRRTLIPILKTEIQSMSSNQCLDDIT